MVSVHNNISGLGVRNLDHPQTVIKSKTSNANILEKNQTGQDFSSVLTKKTNQAAINTRTQQNLEPANTYSPLMLRYGPNKINEIKDIAAETGINDLTNEDFDYAIRYGRSILADYLV
jgi:hypothetical protein